MTSSNGSVDNFLDYWIGHLDKANLSHLFLVHCGGDFGKLAHRIGDEINKLSLSYTILDFIAESERVRDVARLHRNSKDVAVCLVYLLDYARIASDDDYRSLVKNIGGFDYWDIERIRLLADVPNALFDDFFKQSKSELREFADRLISKVQNASEIIVREGEGTNLTVSVKKDSWYSNDGKPSDHILPCGEISTRPIEVNGIVVFEGTILGTIPFGFKYGKIRKGDLILTFEDGEVSGVSGNNYNLVEDIQRIFSRLPVIRKVGETSISFNTGIQELAGLGYQWEERYPGFHFGLGAELTENLTSLSDRQCDHHIDFVLNDCDIYAENTPIFLERNFLL